MIEKSNNTSKLIKKKTQQLQNCEAEIYNPG